MWPDISGVTFGRRWFEIFDTSKVRTTFTDVTGSSFLCTMDTTVETDSSSFSMNRASSDWKEASTDALDDCCGENIGPELIDIDIDLEQKIGSGDT